MENNPHVENKEIGVFICGLEQSFQNLADHQIWLRKFFKYRLWHLYLDLDSVSLRDCVFARTELKDSLKHNSKTIIMTMKGS